MVKLRDAPKVRRKQLAVAHPHVSLAASMRHRRVATRELEDRAVAQRHSPQAAPQAPQPPKTPKTPRSCATPRTPKTPSDLPPLKLERLQLLAGSNSLAPAKTSRLVDSTEYRRSFRTDFESVRDAPLNRHDSGQVPLSAFKNVPKQKIFPGPDDVVLATRPLPPQPPHQEEFYDHYDRWNDSDQAVLTRFRGWHPRSVGWM